MKNKILLTSLIFQLGVLCAWAGFMEERGAGEAMFLRAITEAGVVIKPVDAFTSVGECRIADAVNIRSYSAAEAARALGPCMQILSKRYGIILRVMPSEAVGLVIDTGGASPQAHALSDLRLALTVRHNQLLGHPVKLEREVKIARSALQEVVDGCFMAAVLRDISSSADFIRYYGRCILSEKALGVKQLKPAAQDFMGVEVFTSRALARAESLNGAVSVNAGRGPVTFLVTAFAD